MPPQVQVQRTSLVAAGNAPLAAAPLAAALTSPLWMAEQAPASNHPNLVRRKGGSGGGGSSGGGGGGSSGGTGGSDGSSPPKTNPGGGGGNANTTSIASAKQVKISLFVVALTVLPVIIDSI